MTCANCEESKKRHMFVMTPIGQREFCGDRCYAEYVGVNPDDVRGFYESQIMEDEE